MVLIKLIEILAIGLAVLFFATQIFIPLVRGRPLFGLFRPSVKLEKKLAEEREKTAEAQLQKDIDNERKNRE